MSFKVSGGVAVIVMVVFIAVSFQLLFSGRGSSSAAAGGDAVGVGEGLNAGSAPAVSSTTRAVSSKNFPKISRQHTKLPGPVADSPDLAEMLKKMKKKPKADSAAPPPHAGLARGSDVVVGNTSSVFTKETLSCVVPEVDFRKPSVHIRNQKFQKCNVPVLAEQVGANLVKVHCPPGTLAKVNSESVDDAQRKEFKVFDAGNKGGFLSVQCGRKNDKLAFAALKDDLVKRARSKLEGHEPPMNIVYISVDSLSRAQFHRKFVATAKILDDTESGTGDGLKNMDVYHMRGMNCNGDGTLKTMVPLLTGFDDENHKALGHSGWRGSPGGALDSWPWLFPEMHSRGYVTSWQMDSCMDIWTLNLKGFDNPPWDLPKQGILCGGGTECGSSSSKFSHEHVFDFMRSMLHQYVPQKVGAFVITHLMDGHEGSLAQIGKIDVGLPGMVRWVDEHFGNNTMIAIGGDHGPRYGAYRQTLDGKLEERLPTLTYLMPKKFAQRYPKLAANMRTNQRRLATPFDLHQTLRHIMVLHDTVDDAEKLVFKEGTKPIPLKENGGQSLLFKVPPPRTCDSAGVPSHWCSCMEWNEVDISENGDQELLDVLQGAVASFVNREVSNGTGPCSLLSPKKGGLMSIYKQDLGDRMKKYKIDAAERHRWSSDTALKSVTYVVQTKLFPGGGVFEVRIRSTVWFYLCPRDVDFRRTSAANTPLFSPNLFHMVVLIASFPEFQGIVDVTADNTVDAVIGVNRLSRHDFMSEPCRGQHSFKQKYCVCKSWKPSADDGKEISFKDRFNKTET